MISDSYNSRESWQIEHQCPQCGAPVLLDETDHLLACSYCRTKLYLLSQGPFRYRLPPPLETAKEILYVPYRRYRGLSYQVRGRNIDYRVADLNLLTAPVKGLPFSLGLRPQVLKLKFVSPETEGRFAKVDSALRDLVETALQFGPSGSLQFMIGDVESLIYAPFYREDGRLFDAILKRPVIPWDEGSLEDLLEQDRPLDWQVRFVSTLCPHCGWDLQGEKDALVLLCRNCQTAWICKNSSLEKIDFSVMTGGEGPLVHLPFWRMRADIEGVRLQSYADLIRLANLPKIATPSHEAVPLYFWSPAFKLNPALFMRWTRQMTAYQPGGQAKETFEGASVHPVTMPLADAVGSIPLAIANLMMDKRKMMKLLPDLRMTLTDALLVYQPFLVRRNELIHEKMGLVIHRKALAFGAEL
ncbi:MAG: hypothetical protein JW950_08685 [Deltaproteobacteria bacterium]|nr:hypothetical protein [Deltaproteobacteria bacterium]